MQIIVKDLKWLKHASSWVSSHSYYSIRKEGKQYLVMFDGEDIIPFKTLKKAKEFCYRDFEQFILSCIKIIEE